MEMVTVGTKRCRTCGLVKDLQSFSPQKGNRDGHKNQCKRCHSALTTASSSTIEGREKRSRRYYSRKCAGFTQDTRAAVARYKQRHPIKIAAHAAVLAATRAGLLEKAPCEVCGAARASAHHDDYAKPLVVRWLCSRHHGEWHRIHGPGANGDIL